MTSRQNLDRIRARIAEGERITEAEGRELYDCTDLLELGHLAQIVEERLSGSECSLTTTRRIRYSNVCRNRCRYCHRAVAPGSPEAFTRSVQEVVDYVGAAREYGISQFQLTGGNNTEAPYSYYTDMIAAIRRDYPDVYLEGFAPAQLAAISQFTHTAFGQVLSDLHEAGLDTLLPDGADIFDPEIRRLLCATKATGGTWLQVMREAHGLHLVTGASMLYGHYEGPDEKIEHLSRLRDLQDETGGFSYYVPRAFRTDANLPLDTGLVGGTEDLREFAIGRIFLNDFPHIRCYANDLGMKTTQIALQFGVDAVAVVIHDGEALDDGERARRGLANGLQLAELMTRVGCTICSDDSAACNARPPQVSGG